jgi:argininosuccinate synthase
VRIALAYSGGLDTSIIIPWLMETRPGAEVVAVCADVGQGDDLEQVRAKALASGAKEAYVLDLRERFVTRHIWPALQLGAVYQGRYLLGTALARPVIAQGLAEVAVRVGADAVAHGATGKGNDQVRFEAAMAALLPDMPVIAPWREWTITSRTEAMAYAAAHGVPVDQTPKEPFSRDANLWHISHEGGSLEDVAQPPPAGLLRMSVSPQAAPDAVTEVDVAFQEGVPSALDGMRLAPVALLERLNAVAGGAGVGTVDMVEDRLVGVKSRGVYETPGGTVLYAALEALRSVTLDRRARRLLRDLADSYGELLYDGLYFTPSREAIEAAGRVLMAPATGHVRLALYKGNVQILGVEASKSLYDTHIASFDETGGVEHADATGFLRLYTLPLRTAARAGRTAPAAVPTPEPSRVG